MQATPFEEPVHSFQLETSPDFRFDQVAGYLSRSANECLFEVRDGTLIRCIPVTESIRPIVSIRQTPDNQLTICMDGIMDIDRSLAMTHVKQYVSEWLDLQTDLTPFYEMASFDTLLREPVKQFYGLRLVGVPDLFEAVAWAILGQQINLPFAYTLKRRLVESFGSSVTDNAGKHRWIFPSVDGIASLRLSDLTDLKMTARKAEYLLHTADLIQDGTLSKERLLAAGDATAAERMLTGIRGIGPWTAHYVAMRCLKYRNAFPIQDVGLHLAIQKQLGMDRKPTLPEIRQYAAAWHDWEAYAVFFLWRTLY